jgi:hypothetical protein
MARRHGSFSRATLDNMVLQQREFIDKDCRSLVHSQLCGADGSHLEHPDYLDQQAGIVLRGMAF